MNACNKPFVYERDKPPREVHKCSRPRGHSGPCRTWVEEADLEDEARLWSEPDEVEARWPK